MDYKLISGYRGETDANLDKISASGKKGLTGNTNFKFLNAEDTNFFKATDDFHTSRGLVATGNKTAVTDKNNKKEILEKAMTVVTLECNVQAKGDLIILQGTGFPLVKIPQSHEMGEVENFKVIHASVAGAMIVSVDSPIYSTHGTEFAFWKPELGPTPADINNWFMKHSNGRTTTISGLKPGVIHQFAAAYRGIDGAVLIWSGIVSKTVGD